MGLVREVTVFLESWQGPCWILGGRNGARRILLGSLSACFLDKDASRFALKEEELAQAEFIKSVTEGIEAMLILSCQLGSLLISLMGNLSLTVCRKTLISHFS